MPNRKENYQSNIKMRLTFKEKRKERQRIISNIYKPVVEKLNTYKDNLKKNPTKTEILFKKHLDKNKIKYKFQKAFYNQKFRCIVDFYIKVGKLYIAIEIDGGYHLTKEQEIKDAYRTKWLKEQRSCKMIRFTNDEIISDIDICFYKLAVFFMEYCTLPDSTNYKIFNKILNPN